MVGPSDAVLLPQVILSLTLSRFLVNKESFVDPAGRTHTHRVLVRAVVPVFLSQEMPVKKARSFLIRALAEALRTGHFLQVGDSY